MIKPLKVAFSRNWFVFGSLLTICILFAQAVGAQDLNGYYFADNGGHYYVRTVGETVYWYAEHRGGDWAHVFRGTMNASRTEFEGQFYDIPSGRAYNSGRQRFGIGTLGSLMTGLTPGSFRTARRQTLPRLPNTDCVGLRESRVSTLTGCWNGNDGGKYYMSQGTHSGEEVVVWYGQSNAQTNGRPNFANIAIGTRRGNSIALTWVDVPKGIATGRGTLNLRVDAAAITITRVSGTGFGGSRWTRGLPVVGTIDVTVLPPFTCGGVVMDIDRNLYNTVQIGTQCWMKENLRVTKYNDGTNIPLDESGGYIGNAPGQTWSNRVTGARTVYAHAGSNLATKGYLYNWYAARGIFTNGSTTFKNICPSGWHVPTDAEWTNVIDHLGGLTMAGGKMKATSSLWNSVNGVADNASGFSALPAGYRHSEGSFNEINNSCFFWSATEANRYIAWHRYLNRNNSNVDRDGVPKVFGFPVRCLQDY